ncbi:MAG TPA: secondary thiamine-phosphate synthase enzyme YjbQ [Longimicrobiales bacterium]|nr:secondary thiamine-phosphate synthase enzyme YjbQ [Longimicrobiales bacterium]
MADPRRIKVSSRQREELVECTDAVRAAVKTSGVSNGLIYLWSLHTTCALTVNEGADPDVARDIISVMRALVPRAAEYRHAEGNSDSHVKTSLFGPGLTLLIENYDLVLGTWQHVFLAEWDGPRRRQIAYAIVATAG